MQGPTPLAARGRHEDAAQQWPRSLAGATPRDLQTVWADTSSGRAWVLRWPKGWAGWGRLGPTRQGLAPGAGRM